jgi:leader peptidase (prepilin peptidase)/N-methyltransferase
MSNLALALLSLPFGLAVGSFLNVVAARVPRGQSVVTPASRCMSCETPLTWRENVPVVSYLALRGRCRHCGARFSSRYLAVEVVTALLLAAIVLRFGLTPQAGIYAVFGAALVTLSVIDIEHHILPNRIVLPLFVVIYLAQVARQPDQAVEWTLAALGASGFLFLFALVYPAGMGMGDVKLALAIGAALGLSVTVAMMVGFLAAGVIAAVVIARYGSAGRKVPIPLGPFLALGAVVAMFAGPQIIDAYMGAWA